MSLQLDQVPLLFTGRYTSVTVQPMLQIVHSTELLLFSLVPLVLFQYIVSQAMHHTLISSWWSALSYSHKVAILDIYPLSRHHKPKW